MYGKKWLFRHLPFPCNLDSTLVQPMGIQPCPVSSAAGWVERTGNERTKILLFKRYKLLYKSNNFNNFSGSSVFLPKQKPTSPNSNSTNIEDSMKLMKTSSLRIQPPLIRYRYYSCKCEGANERRLFSQARKPAKVDGASSLNSTKSYEVIQFWISQV